MRNKKETDHAIAILRQKADRLSLLQADILEEARSEQWVFKHFVNVSEECKDEAAFFSARDAARFVAGTLALNELIPGAEAKDIRKANNTSNEEVCVSKSFLAALIRRIEKLERQVSRLKVVVESKSLSENELMTQTEACRYIGCSKITLFRWTNAGIITAYPHGRFTCYNKKELDENPKVQDFINNKK